MIQLTYFSEEQVGIPVYQIIQFRPGEPWQIVDGDRLIGKMKKLDGMWKLRASVNVPDGLVSGIAKLIEGQCFNTLPSDIKLRWPDYVQEVIARSDDRYLVVTKENIPFERFEKIFRTFIAGQVKDEWRIHFRVYNARMSDDFEVIVN